MVQRPRKKAILINLFAVPPRPKKPVQLILGLHNITKTKVEIYFSNTHLLIKYFGGHSFPFRNKFWLRCEKVFLDLSYNQPDYFQ